MSHALPASKLSSKAEETVYLRPGELHVAEKPTIIKTLLGSCVSVVAYHPGTKMGAMTHAQLPKRQGHKGECVPGCPMNCRQDAPDDEEFKYVTCSTRHVLESFQRKGVKLSELEIKLFGGANVLSTSASTLMTVGTQNLDTAEALINEEALTLVSRKTGGEKGMSLVLYSDTGEVFVRSHAKYANGK